MTRKGLKRVLGPDGVGHETNGGEMAGCSVPPESGEDQWDSVMHHLGRILREGGFEGYLGRENSPDPEPENDC